MALPWEGLFTYPQAGKEGSLPFRFENFGTFAGPQFDSLNYDYEINSKELAWHTTIPGDFSFKNLDLGAYLFNNEVNYVGFHCDSVSTAQMTLEASYGNIPNFNVFASNININGNIRSIGDISAVGNITTNGAFIMNGTLSLTGTGDVNSAIKANTALANSKKSFDIPHPSKEGHRLRYICLEGPEAEVYFRGKLTNKSIIELPEVWKGLVDPDTISVSLTAMDVYQELYVESVDWGSKINVKNNLSGPINCTYVVYGTRKDTSKNIPEYEGLTPADYPGDNSEYTINGK
tara:strand:+ start:174 stop:1043 length:870 start_codon:yes stop_codon:yes gene_type:complete